MHSSWHHVDTRLPLGMGSFGVVPMARAVTPQKLAGARQKVEAAARPRLRCDAESFNIHG